MGYLPLTRIHINWKYPFYNTQFNNSSVEITEYINITRKFFMTINT